MTLENNFFTDPINNGLMPLIDMAASPEGVAIATGAGLMLLGTTMLRPHFSSGEKGWMTGFEAWRKGLYGDPKKGIILGRYKGRLICYTGRNHVGIDGTTGTGKTAGPFLATLLSNIFHSFIVFDQSGDLWRLTSGFRSTLGPVYRIDPGLENADCYNPLADIPDSDRIISHLTTLFDPLFAGSLADQKKTGGDPHWEQSPKAILPFIALQVLYGDDPSKKNLDGILKYMEDEEACFADMVGNPRHPRCEQIGKQMLADNKPHRSSVMAMIYTALSLWRDDSISKMTSSSSFSIEELATNKSGPVTIYLTAETTALKRMMPFYVIIEEMLKIHLMKYTKKTLSGKDKVRGIIIMDDEAQNTKRPSIDVLEVARKFQIQYMLGYQSLNAMADLYGEPKLGLLKTKLSFRPTVADKVVSRIVEMSGTYKRKVVSYSESISRGKGRSRSTSWKIEESPRITKGEFENEWTEFGRGLLTHPGKPAVLSTFDSETDPEFSKFIKPEYNMNRSILLRSPWDSIVKPVLVSSPVSKEIQTSPKTKELPVIDMSEDAEDISLGEMIMQRLNAEQDNNDEDDSEQEELPAIIPTETKPRRISF